MGEVSIHCISVEIPEINKDIINNDCNKGNTDAIYTDNVNQTTEAKMVIDLNKVYMENSLSKRKENVGVEAVNYGLMTLMIRLNLNQELDNNREEGKAVIGGRGKSSTHGKKQRVC